jgi:quercetin dioxygenase-like cupin family protein
MIMSEVHRFIGNAKQSDYRWDGVEPTSYNNQGLKNVTKHILVGSNENAPNYRIRYFKLDKDGHSRLETHPHEHGVLILHGRGVVQIKENEYDVKPYDALFISGGDLHQFRNNGDEPFGFICVIPPIEM